MRMFIGTWVLRRIPVLWGDFALQIRSGISTKKKPKTKQTQKKAKCKTNPKNPQAGGKPVKTEFVQYMLLLELPKLLQSISEGCDCFRCCLILISLESLSHLCLINLWEEGVSPWQEHCMGSSALCSAAWHCVRPGFPCTHLTEAAFRKTRACFSCDFWVSAWGLFIPFIQKWLLLKKRRRWRDTAS